MQKEFMPQRYTTDGGRLVKHLAIIPARSGSKGVVDKNIKMLEGKPLLAYTVEAALKSAVFDRVMVSTDAERYAAVAREYGAEVPFLRSRGNASDTASTWDSVKEVLTGYKEQGETFDSVCVLQPTSPLRTAWDIIGGYELFQSKEANAVVGVCAMEHSPLYANVLGDDGCMDGFIRAETAAMQRQKLPAYYRINGALYILREEYLWKMSSPYDKGSYAYIMPVERSVDIDTAFDFMWAAYLLSKQSAK